MGRLLRSPGLAMRRSRAHRRAMGHLEMVGRPHKRGRKEPEPPCRSPNRRQAKLGRAVGNRAIRRGESGWEGLGGPLWLPASPGLLMTWWGNGSRTPGDHDFLM